MLSHRQDLLERTLFHKNSHIITDFLYSSAADLFASDICTSVFDGPFGCWNRKVTVDSGYIDSVLPMADYANLPC